MAYTNSPLVNYTRISPNRTINRGKPITLITIHCVVGQASVESLGNIFANPSRQASSNYGIGYDGRIGMYVEEKDRSWCSGGEKKVNGITGSINDYSAVTIEVASDNTYPYAVTGEAYESLIRLCADICKRNGIPKLIWKADPNLVGHPDQQNMTVHRWFAYKSCPGDYLYERHYDIAERVNKLLEAEKGNVIEEDGKWGKQTNIWTQKLLGTLADGVVSNQPSGNRRYLLNATTGWVFKPFYWQYKKGSDMVRAIQKHIGAGVDGWFGPLTVASLQKFLAARGLYDGEIDGYLGPKSVLGWQRYVNNSYK